MHTYTHMHSQLFYGPFSVTTRVSRCQKKFFFCTLWWKGRQQKADTLTIQLGATISGLISDPSPTFSGNGQLMEVLEPDLLQLSHYSKSQPGIFS